jgi:hypothetical protein
MKYKFYKEDIINIDDFISEMVELLNKIKMEKYDINDIIEIYERSEALRYNKDKLENKTFKEYNDSTVKIITAYDTSEIENDMKIIEFTYINSFFEMIQKYNLYINIKGEVFKKILAKKNITYILRYPKIVEYFEKIITDYLLIFEDTAKILLEQYILESLTIPAKYIPNNVIEKSDEIFEKYIESENVNINYLEFIVNLRRNNILKVNNKVKLKAKEKIELIKKDYNRKLVKFRDISFKMQKRIKLK